MLKFLPISVDGFHFLKVDFSNGGALFERAYSTAKNKSEHISVLDPSGNARDKDEVFSQNFMGALADLVCYRLMRGYFKKHNYDIDVVRYDDIRVDGFKNHDQFDLKLIGSSKEEYVEVRSSVCVRMPLISMINKWHMLGPYSSEVKGDTEHFSKYYIRPMFHLDSWKENVDHHTYSRRDGMRLVMDGSISLYILGGAEHDVFDKIGWRENGETIKQNKASYLVINIKNGLEPESFLAKIVDDFK